MQLLMSGVDLLYQDTNRLVSYEKNIAKQMQMKQQFIQKRVSYHSFVKLTYSDMVAFLAWRKPAKEGQRRAAITRSWGSSW